jgi:hypothetical protein
MRAKPMEVLLTTGSNSPCLRQDKQCFLLQLTTWPVVYQDNECELNRGSHFSNFLNGTHLLLGLLWREKGTNISQCEPNPPMGGVIAKFKAHTFSLAFFWRE